MWCIYPACCLCGRTEQQANQMCYLYGVKPRLCMEYVRNLSLTLNFTLMLSCSTWQLLVVWFRGIRRTSEGGKGRTNPEDNTIIRGKYEALKDDSLSNSWGTPRQHYRLHSFTILQNVWLFLFVRSMDSDWLSDSVNNKQIWFSQCCWVLSSHTDIFCTVGVFLFSFLFLIGDVIKSLAPMGRRWQIAHCSLLFASPWADRQKRKKLGFTKIYKEHFQSLWSDVLRGVFSELVGLCMEDDNICMSVSWKRVGGIKREKGTGKVKLYVMGKRE